MSSPAARRAARIMKAIGPESQSWGMTQRLWNTRLTPEEKRKLLFQYSNLSPAQIRLALPLPWSSLNLHVRKSLKRFFRTKPEGHSLFPESAKKQKRRS